MFESLVSDTKSPGESTQTTKLPSRVENDPDGVYLPDANAALSYAEYTIRELRKKSGYNPALMIVQDQARQTVLSLPFFTEAGEIDGSLAVHARRLGRVRIECMTGDHTNAVMLPLRGMFVVIRAHGCLLRRKDCAAYRGVPRGLLALDICFRGKGGRRAGFSWLRIFGLKQ
jgi:hypothetical protein